jgi:hypothetical protein
LFVLRLSLLRLRLLTVLLLGLLEVFIEDLPLSVLLGRVNWVTETKPMLVVLLTLEEVMAGRILQFLLWSLGLLLLSELAASSSIKVEWVSFFFIHFIHRRGSIW